MKIHVSYDELFMRDFLKEKISSTVALLLESKHLYQSMEVGFDEVRNAPLSNEKVPLLLNSNPARTKEALINSFATGAWSFEAEVHEYTGASAAIGGSESVTLVAPTIKISCNHCDAVCPPHNSGFKGLREPILQLTLKPPSTGVKIVQVFFLPYQCQSCRGEPLIFVVRRCGTKLQIVGRSQFEKVQVPKSIPREEKEYYSDAVIAFQTGRILAALFYLRTLVEQYFRRILRTDERVSGEDLGDQYATLLDDEFPKKFTSLKTVYQKLSSRLHSAEKDEK